MTKYIYEYPKWPNFIWDNNVLMVPLGKVRHQQGRLLGYMEALGFPLRDQAILETLTLDVIKTNEIEGENLSAEQVRSSIARHLGMDISGLVPSDRQIDGVVDMMVDATHNYDKPLTKERLFDWHAALFPAGRSGMYKIITGNYRSDATGPMQVVSGAMGKEHVHFQALAAKLIAKEMNQFLNWFNKEDQLDPVIKAGIAHLWFITIHPFDDGNGRIARAIADLQLSRGDECSQRFYSMSAQIRKQRSKYYNLLENTQQGSLDITDWLQWFLACLNDALSATDQTLKKVLDKARFWEKHATVTLNERQRVMINKLFDGFSGNLTSSKWAKITKCSADTALRDIQDLITKDMMDKDLAGGRSTNYVLKKAYIPKSSASSS